MPAKATTRQLRDGQTVPCLGLGTWLSKPGEVTAAVKTAIAEGYRLIDCAYLYLNEKEVGQALKEVFAEGEVKREDLFITSKLWNTRHSPNDVRPSLLESLELLGLDYVDLYYIHWPHSYKPGKDNFPRDEAGNIEYVDINPVDTYKALEKCQDEGLTKSLGLSNFNSIQIQDIWDNSKNKPVSLQVEVHPYFPQKKLIEFCRKKDIMVMGYSPLGAPARPWVTKDEPVLLEDPKIKEIAEKYKKTTAQVILRWHIQSDVLPIPKSVTASRIAENIDVFDFELSADDMAVITGFGRPDGRVIAPVIEVDGKRVHRDKNAPYYPFQDDIEF